MRNLPMEDIFLTRISFVYLFRVRFGSIDNLGEDFAVVRVIHVDQPFAIGVNPGAVDVLLRVGRDAIDLCGDRHCG